MPKISPACLPFKKFKCVALSCQNLFNVSQNSSENQTFKTTKFECIFALTLFPPYGPKRLDTTSFTSVKWMDGKRALPLWITYS